MDERIAGQHTLLSFYRRYVIAETLTEIGIGKHNLREAYRKRGLPANHRARQCTLELPGRRIRVRYELQERHTQPSCSRIRHPTPAHRPSDSLITHPAAAPRPGGSLIRRRCGGGVGNRCRWAERFALSEQRPYVAAMGIDAYMLIDAGKSACRSCELANPAQVCQIASQTGVLLSAG